MKFAYGKKALTLPPMYIRNRGTDEEYAVCSACGYRVIPLKTSTFFYPVKCPGCKTRTHITEGGKE